MTHPHEELLRLAKAATPGPWKPIKADHTRVNHVVHLHFPGADIEDMRNQYDLFCRMDYSTCEFIAAANPQAVIKLIEENLIMREALEFYGNDKNHDFDVELGDTRTATLDLRAVPILAHGVVLDDSGKIAREALSRINKVGG